MSDYADFTAEDAYDATDPIGVRLDVLAAIVEAVRDDPDDVRRAARRADALRLVAGLYRTLDPLADRLDTLNLELLEIT